MGSWADARSDLFALGAVLYEMVTGEAPFGGKSQASVIASILEKEPPPVTDRAKVAPGRCGYKPLCVFKGPPSSRIWSSYPARASRGSRAERARPG